MPKFCHKCFASSRHRLEPRRAVRLGSQCMITHCLYQTLLLHLWLHIQFIACFQCFVYCRLHEYQRCPRISVASLAGSPPRGAKRSHLRSQSRYGVPSHVLWPRGQSIHARLNPHRTALPQSCCFHLTSFHTEGTKMVLTRSQNGIDKSKSSRAPRRVVDDSDDDDDE